jgi:cytochrome c oxidase subunit 4
MKGREVPEVRTYLVVWVGLLTLLTLTLGSAYVPMGTLNTVANLGIAVAKAALVMLFYMHLRQSSGLTRLFAVAGFVWLGLLIGLTLTDVLTRAVPPAPW